jgi:YD repeat-containing protein
MSASTPAPMAVSLLVMALLCFVTADATFAQVEEYLAMQLQTQTCSTRNGKLLTSIDARGKTTTWAYDEMDRVATRTDPLTRDAGDRATAIVDSIAGTIGRTFDLLDRLTDEVTPEGTLTDTHDDASRRARMTVAGQTAGS